MCRISVGFQRPRSQHAEGTRSAHQCARNKAFTRKPFTSHGLPQAKPSTNLVPNPTKRVVTLPSPPSFTLTNAKAHSGVFVTLKLGRLDWECSGPSLLLTGKFQRGGKGSDDPHYMVGSVPIVSPSLMPLFGLCERRPPTYCSRLLLYESQPPCLKPCQ